MDFKLRYLIIAILGLLAVGLISLNIVVSNNSNKVEAKIEKVKLPEKQEINKTLTVKEVKELEKVVKGKIDDFLVGAYKDDTEGEGSAYDVMRGLFTPTSHHVVLTDKSSEKDIIEYYDPFEYEISNFGGRYTNDGREVIMQVRLKYNGNSINEKYSMISFELDSNNKFKGGMLYGESE